MMEVTVQEVIPELNKRTALGRVVVNPPTVMGALKQRTTGKFYMCCTRAFLTEESYRKHLQDKIDHGKPIDVTKFPRTPFCFEKFGRAIYDRSSKEFWMTRKKRVTIKNFYDDLPQLSDIELTEEERLETVTFTNVDNSLRRGRWKKCSICNLSTLQCNMQRHMRTCHTNGKYKCQYCPCTFLVDFQRKIHQSRMHQVQSLPSHSAKHTIVARAKNQLVSSKITTSLIDNFKKGGRKEKVCPICGKNFYNSTRLRDHMNSHSGARPYKCEICGFGFSHFSNLRRHKRTTHTKDAKVTCSICNCGFSNTQSLARHYTSMHPQKLKIKKLKSPEKEGKTVVTDVPSPASEEIPIPDLTPQHPSQNKAGLYQCPVCKKELSTPQTWRGHMLIHQNLKPHKCKLCGIYFRLYATMAHHKLTSHTNGAYRCQLCPCTFNTLRSLERHSNVYHSKKNLKIATTKDNVKSVQNKVVNCKCNLCGVEFKNLNEFSKHELLHSEANRTQCDLCLKDFTNPVNVTIHKTRAHGSGTHRCPFCCCRYMATQALFTHLVHAHQMKREEWNFTSKTVKPEARVRIQKCLNWTFYNGNTAQSSNPTEEIEVESSNDVSNENKIRVGTVGPIRKYACTICNHRFVWKGSVYNHMKRAHRIGKFSCSKCSHTSRTQEEILKHEALMHGIRREKKKPHKTQLNQERRVPIEASKSDGSGKKFECNLCHAKFLYPGSVGQHIKRAHDPNGKFECKDCTCKYMSKPGLIKHQVLSHGYITNKRANLQFKKGSLVNTHGLIVDRKKIVPMKGKERRLQCSQCSKAFISEKYLRIHMDIHTGKKFECDLCHVRLLTRANVLNHKKNSHFHDGEFQCLECCCKFLTPGGLINHRKVHHGLVSKRRRNKTRTLQQNVRMNPGLANPAERKEQTFKCDTCSEVLESSWALKHHRQIHTSYAIHTSDDGKTMYECDLCHIKLSHPGSVNHHKKKCHFHNGKFKCRTCSCKFLALHGLLQHQRRYHPKSTKRLKITDDSKPTTTPTKVMAHKVVGTSSHRTNNSVPKLSKCDICELNIFRHDYLPKHKEVAHTNGKYKCTECCCCFHTPVGLTKHKTWHETGSAVVKRKPDDGDKRDEVSQNLGTNENSASPASTVNRNFLKIRGSPTKRAVTVNSLSHKKTQIKVNTVKQVVLSSTTNGPVKCSKCGIKFSKLSLLKYHIKKNHTNGNFKCDRCTCVFKNAHALAAHKRIHPGTEVLNGLQASKITLPKNVSSLKELKVPPAAAASTKTTNRKNEDSWSPPKNANKSVGLQEESTLSETKVNMLTRSRRETVSGNDIKPEEHQKRDMTRKNESETVLKQASKYSCSWCGKSFSTERVLKQHNLSHTRPEECSKCGLRFRNKDDIKLHALKAHGDGQFQCYICTCRFTTGRGLKAHMKLTHERQSASCRNMFVIENEHEESVEGEPFIPEMFEFEYPHRNGDSEVYEESEPIVEGILETNYSSNINHSSLVYNSHQVVQETEPPLLYINENEEYADESEPGMQGILPIGLSVRCPTPPPPPQAVSRKRTFTPKSRPMKCTTCDTTCLGPENLRKHMESHLVEPRNILKVQSETSGGKCNKCGTEFADRSELIQHLKVEHDNSGLYRCAYCPCTMKTETDLRFHFMKHHSG